MTKKAPPQKGPGLSLLQRLYHLYRPGPKNKDELIAYLHHAKKNKLLNHDVLQMLEGVFTVTDMRVRDVMVPRTQMIVLPHEASTIEILPTIVRSNHSRFPVISNNHEEILGILLAKDVLKEFSKEQPRRTPLKTLIRPATMIPESKRLDVLLKEFRLNHHHMAIVIDEYGGVSGLITIEDVLEQIVGDIEDEHDHTNHDPLIQKISDTEYTVKGLTPIAIFNQYFNITLSDRHFDTIAGYITQQLGHLPKRGESFTTTHFHYTVVLASNRRLKLLRLTTIDPDLTE